ncbi:MAG: polyphosphate kinase 1 [Sphaerospermopsis sp. SIO1G2]|nr:polyphosphate kinase 1 [Sphaerospermopsis sp. SIO1G2]
MIDWQEDPFAQLRRGAVLLHHPFQSFQPVTELVEAAAADDRVLAIKQTLYRVSGNSPIVRALMRAARSGKQVTVLVELKARFDEEANIRWARQLEQAGAHVIYGLMGLKVHSKLLMIIRRDIDGIRRYCHVGTGNFNDKTARLYTDLSYLTASEMVGRDVANLFNMLTGFTNEPEMHLLEAAPTTMRRAFSEAIRREAEFARNGRGGRIIAKFNSMVDVGICEELYAASQAGVEIDLIVRGMCILRAGVSGLSENIRVRSIIGRYLEHSRIFYFGGGGHSMYFIGSADWMTRNLDRRVEAMVRIEEPELQDELASMLQRYLDDNRMSRELQPDGTYRRLVPQDDEQARAVQPELMAWYHQLEQRLDDPAGRDDQVRLMR